jgi:WD40 repeat protein
VGPLPDRTRRVGVVALNLPVIVRTPEKALMDTRTLQQRYTPKQTKVINLEQQACMLRFSPDGKVLAAACFDQVVRRLDATTDPFAPLPPVAGHNGWVQCLAFHPDGKRAFSADTWGQVRAWPFAEAEPKPLWNVAQAHDGWVRGLVVSPDGKTLATCGADRAIRLWSADDGKKLTELAAGEDVHALLFHPDGKSLVSGDLKGVVKVWDVASGKAARELDARGLYLYERLQDVGGVRCLAFDKTGATLACGGCQPKGGGFVEGTLLILLFDWVSGKVKETITFGAAADGFVKDLHLHADGFLMAVSSGQPGNGKLFFFNPGDKEPFFTAPMANCHSLALHPNGTRLAVAATNANSAGNGRPMTANKEYPGNFSPIHIWDMPGTGK